jgi:hypothetical protein
VGALPKLNFPPLAMNRETALAYTGLAPKLFDQIERQGGLAGKKLGRNGEKIYPRDQLEQIIQGVFVAANLDLDDEIAGLNG